MKRKHFITSSAQDTQRVAAELAKSLERRPKRRHALVLALKGDLGSGKTTFTQGFAKELGIKEKVLSPTFLIVKQFGNVYHIDCYRIQKERELLDLGWKEIVADPQNIVLVEWPERIKGLLPKDTLWLSFTHGKELTQREIVIG